jgi:hypothetical protein
LTIATRRAERPAEADMDRPPARQELTREEVFEDTYDERTAGQ